MDGRMILLVLSRDHVSKRLKKKKKRQKHWVFCANFAFAQFQHAHWALWLLFLAVTFCCSHNIKFPLAACLVNAPIWSSAYCAGSSTFCLLQALPSALLYGINGWSPLNDYPPMINSGLKTRHLKNNKKEQLYKLCQLLQRSRQHGRRTLEIPEIGPQWHKSP